MGRTIIIMSEEVVVTTDPINLIVAIIIALIFGVMFFISDYYEERPFKIHKSLIAGISVSYFFVLLLPEIQENLPEYPLHLQTFEFLFILIGFAFVHITEKLILQKVEEGTQRRLRKLIEKEKTLVTVENNMEKILSKELNHETLDEAALREIVRALNELKENHVKMREEIEQYKIKIQKHVNWDLEELHFFSDYFYHFLIGIILFNVLIIDLVSGILFSIFAWFRAIISTRLEAHQLFSDLDITVEFHETHVRKYILASAALSGIGLGLLLEFVMPLNLELLFLMYSFISGVILYTIVREVIPEREKGKPLYFLIGVFGFTILILIIKYFQYSF